MRLVMLTVTLVALAAAPVWSQQQSVDVRDDAFAPARVTVEEGGTVVWTQSGSNPHSVTASDGSFDSHPACPPDCMGQGGSHSQTFTTAGEFAYYCKLHGSAGGGGMAGVVVVTAMAEPEPEPEAGAEEPAAQLADTGLPTAALFGLAVALLLAGLAVRQRIVAPPRHSSPS